MVTTLVHVDPTDPAGTPEARFPTDAEIMRPTVHLRGGDSVGASPIHDADAAAWWRTLAASREGCRLVRRSVP
jgi:hypothetical protein